MDFYPDPALLSPSSATMSTNKSTVRGRPPLPSGPRLRKPSSQVSLIHTESSGHLSPLSISPSVTDPSPILPPIYEASPYFPRHTAEKSVQVPPPSAAKVQATPLPSPAPIDFEIPPTAFKGLPLEAARWTFSSGQLQQIVSRSIRDTAKESSLRLLSLDVLDNEMPKELDNLDTTRLQTQAKFRFLAHRRNMLLQSLHSYAFSHDGSDPDVKSTLASLISQLGTLLATLDTHTHTLLQTTTHKHQLHCMHAIHQASALAVALRKLNDSYKKRTDELKKARQRISELEAELEEAWACAEDVALEVDAEEEEAGDSTMDFTGDGISMAEVMGISGTAVVTTAKLQTTSTTTTTVEISERQVRNSRRMSRISTASTATSRTSQSRVSRVTAARKRSIRASKASLRLPKSVLDEIPSPTDPGTPGDPAGVQRRRERSRSRSRARGKTLDTKELPPVPRLNLDVPKGDSFLDLDNGSRSTLPHARERTSTIGVGDMLVGRRKNNIDDYDPVTNPHPFSAPYNGAKIPPMYTQNDNYSPSDDDSDDDQYLPFSDTSKAKVRGRAQCQLHRTSSREGVFNKNRPETSRVHSMQAPPNHNHDYNHTSSASFSHPMILEHRESQRGSVLFESSVRESTHVDRNDAALLRRGASTPQLKRTFGDYFRITRSKRYTMPWGERGAGRGDGAASVSRTGSLFKSRSA